MKVVVIGGGPAGMMSAIFASKQGHNVTLLERNEKLGKKLLVTGNRRCNITNYKSSHDLVNIIHNGRFLYSAFNQFDVDSIVNFFKEYELEFHEEQDNRMYPITQKSSDVLKVFYQALEDHNVNVMTNQCVDNLIATHSKITHVSIANKTIQCDHVIIATGGLSFPVLGSDGLGHQMLHKHNIKSTETYPCEAALISKDPLIKSLRLVGMSLQNVELSVLNQKGKDVFKTTGDIIFTHQGLSGPACLKCSEHIYHQLKLQKPTLLRLRFITTLNQQQFSEDLKNHPHETIKKYLNMYLTKRLTDYLLETLSIDSSTQITQLSNKTLELLYQHLFRFDIMIHKTETVARAFVTGGGIDLKQIDSKSLKHKEIQNLSLCGELLDIHGPLGGYNLTIAMITGMFAGSNL